MPTEVNHKERPHARMGGSMTERLFNCPGSVLGSVGIEKTTSEAAREGTAAHEMVQYCLENNEHAFQWIDREIGATADLPGFKVDEDWAEACQEWLDACRERMIHGQYTWWIERPVSLEALDPPEPMYGTADFVAYDPVTQILYVYDFKFGKGISVGIEGNRQLLYYTLGVLLGFPDDKPVKQVVMRIIQPRITTGPTDKQATTTPMEVIEWSVELMEKAHLAMSPDAPYHAGPWCRNTFCPRSGQCQVELGRSVFFAQTTFEEIMEETSGAPVIQEPDTLSAFQISRALDLIPLFQATVISIQEVARKRLEWDPQSIPGWGLEAKRPFAKWLAIANGGTDEDAAQAVLDAHREHGVDRINIWTRKVKSQAQVRDVLKAHFRATEHLTAKAAEAKAKELLAPLIDRRSSGFNLVPVAKLAGPSTAKGLIDLFPDD